MKINGRFGRFTPRPQQAAFYARRAGAEVLQRQRQSAALREWLERHEFCANGCGKPVAFYDTVHYCLQFDGCCSAECAAAVASS